MDRGTNRVRSAIRSLLFDLRLVGRALTPTWLRMRLQSFGPYRVLVDSLPYEESVAIAVRRTVEQGWTAVDVGGHMGRYTVELAKLVGPSGSVFVFEPHAENVRAIEQRVVRNGLAERVVIVRSAVADVAYGQLPLYPGRRSSTAEWSLLAPNPQAAAVGTVQVTSLDAAMGDSARVDFVKIDIEGAEHLALRGMASLLRVQRPTLLIELHRQGNLTECVEILTAAGYGLRELDGRTQFTIDPRAAVQHVLALPL